MKIISRPDDMPAGEGPFLLKMTAEELQYIGSMLWNTRLGDDSIYKEAAFKLTNTMEELFGEDFLQDASDVVDMSISVVDDQNNVIAIHHNSALCIEV